MAADRRLTELVLDDRTSSLSRQEVQRAIVEAANTAWAAGRGADPAAAAAANVDPVALRHNLQDLQDQAVRSMNLPASA